MMWQTFSNHKEKDNNTDMRTLSPYRTSPKWAIESAFLEIYLLLAHRIKGLGWSLQEFWECDTWTISKLYCRELDLIDEEEAKMNESEDEKHDSEEMKDLMVEMYGNDGKV